MIHVLYWQARHVYDNISFSKIAVRNNHAITECLGIYLFGMLLPFFPESAKWRKLGKQWFEKEIAYQIYEDGTYLRFSMNYHRVVVQLLTWAIKLNQLNDKPFDKIVYKRAKASLQFLRTCMNVENGMLPNYGANDGALFFKFNDQPFRDYRPQLQALALCIGESWDNGSFEDQSWFGLDTNIGLPLVHGKETEQLQYGKFNFHSGGYYLIKDEQTLTFIRCGNHKDRPSQADNLHLDIWVGGENIMRDAGSYKYNASEEEIKYFFGLASHNTIMLNSFDQMLKGPRFVWYFWTQSKGAGLVESTRQFHFFGRISAFRYLRRAITHKRTVVKTKGELCWEITDEVINNPGLYINQLWHPHPSFFDQFDIQSCDEKGQVLSFSVEEGFYSGLYGKKEACSQLVFTSKGKITTTIKRKR